VRLRTLKFNQITEASGTPAEKSAPIRPPLPMPWAAARSFGRLLAFGPLDHPHKLRGPRQRPVQTQRNKQ
jgi:hypothetical protein